jgi:YD repeat-containing protein
VLLLATFSYGTYAAQERYDYDGLGRLIRVIDEQGRVTEYVYDAAGNLLQVITGGTAQAPTVTAISPNSIRRAETRTIQITGTGLTGAHVSAGDPGLDITGLQAAATQITFSLTATLSAALGTHVFSISNAAGTSSASITVNPALPKLAISPLPIVVAVEGPARNFSVTISSTDNIDHVVSLATANPAIATVTPSSLTFIAGETEKTVTITGLSPGTTTIDLTSTTLAAISVPVGVGRTLLGDAVSVTRPVSVHLPAPAPSAPPGNSMSVTRSVSVHLPAPIPGAPPGNAMSVTQSVSVHLPAVIPGAPAGNAMSVTRPVSVHLPALIAGAPSGDAMSVTRSVSVHLPAEIPGAPSGNAMSVTQPVSVSMP